MLYILLARKFFKSVFRRLIDTFITLLFKDFHFFFSLSLCLADTMHNSKEEAAQYRSRSELNMYEHIAIDGDMFLQVRQYILYLL